MNKHSAVKRKHGTRLPVRPRPTHAVNAPATVAGSSRMACNSQAAHRVAPPIGRDPIVDPSLSVTLDVIRVVAINLVVMDHVSGIFFGRGGLSARGISVILFFLMSGFLITRISLARAADAGPKLGNFLVDRGARVFTPFLPALALTIGLNFALSLPVNPVLGMNHGLWPAIANAALLNDYPLFQLLSHFFDVGGIFPRSYNGSESFWTIPVEFWIYVSFAAAAFVLVGGERPSAFQTTLMVVALPVFFWNLFAGGGGDLSLLWIMGSVAGLLWDQVKRLEGNQRIFGWMVVLMSSAALAGRVADVGYIPYDLQGNMLVALCFFGIILLGSGRSWRADGILAKSARMLASYSYSLFLVHNIVLFCVKTSLPDLSLGIAITLAVLASHASAILFFWCFERHYRALARHLKKLNSKTC